MQKMWVCNYGSRWVQVYWTLIPCTAVIIMNVVHWTKNQISYRSALQEKCTGCAIWILFTYPTVWHFTCPINFIRCKKFQILFTYHAVGHSYHMSYKLNTLQNISVNFFHMTYHISNKFYTVLKIPNFYVCSCGFNYLLAIQKSISIIYRYNNYYS